MASELLGVLRVADLQRAFKRADIPFNVVSSIVYEEEYRRRHGEIYPEMVEALREAGVRNYSIFRHGLTLFGYFETDDLGQTRRYLTNSEVNQRWGESMEPVIKLEIDPNTNFPYLLPLQWHMDQEHPGKAP